MKIRLEWRTHPVVFDGVINEVIFDEREYVTLNAKDVRRLCEDVSTNGVPYLIEVIHSDPVVPRDQSVRTTVHHG